MKSFILLLCILVFGLQPSHAEDKLIIVSPHWEGIRYEMGRAFNEHRRKIGAPSVKISWLDVGGTSEILRYLQSEYMQTPEGVQIDMLFGGGIEPFLQLKASGLLERPGLHGEELAGVAHMLGGVPLHDPDGYYYAPVISAFGLLCNLEVLRTIGVSIPAKWSDLTGAEYRGWLSSADPRKSGSTHMFYEILLQAYGWEQGWKMIFNIAGNINSFSSHSSQVTQDVIGGETACGFAIDSQAWAQIERFGSDKLAFIVPSDASFANGDSAAILKGAPNYQLASDFLSFLLSEAAQKVWMYRPTSPGGPSKYELARLGVRPSLYSDLQQQSSILLNPFSWDSSLPYDHKLGAARWGLLNELLGTFVLTAKHYNLAYSGKLPVNEEQAMSLISSGDWHDQGLRRNIVAGWRSGIFREIDEGSLFWLNAAPTITFILLCVLAIVVRARRFGR
ncbi:MAG: extracellular solute-binding protein [Deltaproteobacteria bacterium]|nr:extracellular solute-binding protein [Deltaproteobacteria bacterium]